LKEDLELAMFFNYDVDDAYGEEAQFEDLYNLNN
jgi:hypothetical protein